MAKRQKIVEVDELITPEETLGLILFARKSAEQIVHIFNDLSAFVSNNEHNLHFENDLEAEPNETQLQINNAFNQLEQLTLKLSHQISNLRSV